jgi:hypothetical protein
MGNITTPFGLKPLRYWSGKAYAGACRPYYIRSDYATALYINDPVVLAPSSTRGGNAAVVQCASGGSFLPGTLQTINKITAGTAAKITGTIVGFLPGASGRDSLVYNAASTERVALVADDPDLLFLIKDDGAAALTYASVSYNANMSTSTAGSTATGISGVALAAGTTPAADATYQLLIMGADQTPDNIIGSAYQNWVVAINLHTYRSNAILGV